MNSFVVAIVIVFASGCSNNLNSQGNSTNKTQPTSQGNSTSRAQPKSEEPLDTNAINLVSRAIEQNKLGVTGGDLRTKKNPKGEGTFVYVPQTRFSGVERYIIWMIIDSKAYALNSPSKMVTPSLPWPREGNDATWNKTGIDKFNGASEAIAIIFRNQ
jgi:hypothetical protein